MPLFGGTKMKKETKEERKRRLEAEWIDYQELLFLRKRTEELINSPYPA